MIQIAIQSPVMFFICVMFISYLIAHVIEFFEDHIHDVFILRSLRNEKGEVTREILEAYSEMIEHVTNAKKSEKHEDRD